MFALLIWLSGLYIGWAALGLPVPDPRTAAFQGEFVAFLAFGASWLTKGAEREILIGDDFGDDEDLPDPMVAA